MGFEDCETRASANDVSDKNKRDMFFIKYVLHTSEHFENKSYY